MTCVLGFDVGGTHVRGAMADLGGTVLATRLERTAREGGEVDQLVRMADELAGETAPPRAAAVGVPGAVDPRSGRVRLVPNAPGLDGLALADMLTARLGLPARVENDADLAALGEHAARAGDGVESLAAVAIGTGIGVGVVLDGALWRGRRGAAGEIGYLPIPVAAPLAEQPCGALETHAGAEGLRALVREALAAVEDPSPLRGADLDALDLRRVAALAADGDAVAVRACELHGRIVALAVAAIAALLDPQLVVLAGGLGANPQLLGVVQRELPRHVPLPPTVELSRCGERAQLEGALAVARRLVEETACAT